MTARGAIDCTPSSAPRVSLACPRCKQVLEARGESYDCAACAERFPVENGIPRLLPRKTRQALSRRRSRDPAVATAQSFGYEWSHFPKLHAAFERDFLSYMAPRGLEELRGKTILDAGCGNGRYARCAGRAGGEVWALDLGPAVSVARRNTLDVPSVRVVQGDLLQAPFAPGSFDLVYSLGVLHHLADPEAGFRALLELVKPGGEIRVSLYWRAEGQPLKGRLLDLVSLARRVTTRLPFELLHALAYPAAAAAFVGLVLPHLLLKKVGQEDLAARFPMKQYADYPFSVCVNDQFDRFSAPIEKRFARGEAEAWLARAGLDEARVEARVGWLLSGKRRGEP